MKEQIGSIHTLIDATIIKIRLLQGGDIFSIKMSKISLKNNQLKRLMHKSNKKTIKISKVQKTLKKKLSIKRHQQKIHQQTNLPKKNKAMIPNPIKKSRKYQILLPWLLPNLWNPSGTSNKL